MRSQVEKVRDALVRWDQRDLANRVEAALAGSDADLEMWAVSDALWGGDGSIADGSGGSARLAWREIEATLIDLGEYLIAAGLENDRMCCWVRSFETARRAGI